MIQPSALRIGQKIKHMVTGGAVLEWTVWKLTKDSISMSHSGFTPITCTCADIDPIDIVPTDYDKAVETLLALVAECIDDEHIDKDAEGMESYLKKAMELVDKLRQYDVTETLQKSSEAK